MDERGFREYIRMKGSIDKADCIMAWRIVKGDTPNREAIWRGGFYKTFNLYLKLLLKALEG